eukprot:4029604-Prymnesium_polylepis.1
MSSGWHGEARNAGCPQLTFVNAVSAFAFPAAPAGAAQPHPQRPGAAGWSRRCQEQDANIPQPHQ